MNKVLPVLASVCMTAVPLSATAQTTTPGTPPANDPANAAASPTPAAAPIPQQQSPADATAPQGASSAADALLGDIVVTAQKRSVGEAAQSVPIALTAFNQAALDVSLVQNLRDVGFLSPNTQLLQNGTTPGLASFAIRGLGTNDSTESFEPTVGLVKDGLVYAQRYGSFIETFDLESVEILRGPQGTLFGRNVTAGVVNVRSRRPSLRDGVHGEVGTVVGTNSRFDLTGYADATLIPGKLGIILSAARLTEDGSVKNDNAIGGTLGDRHVENYRAAISYHPTPGIDLLLTYEHGLDQSDTTPAVDPAYSTSFFHADRDIDSQINLKTNTYILEGNIEVPGGVLTVITGHRKTDYRDNGIADIDGGPTPTFGFRQNLQDKQTSVEARYATKDLFANLDFTAGLFYMEHDFTVVASRYIGPPLAPIQLLQPSAARQDATSWALFAQGEWRFADTLGLTLGGRYSHEDKAFDIAPRATGACGSAPLFGTDTLPDIGSCAFVGAVSDSWSDFSPMGRLTWKPRPGITAYASVAKGFRSGGYNSQITSAALVDGKPLPYDDESLLSYEVGVKSDWLDRRLRVNLAAFYNKADDLQIEVTGPAPALAKSTFNAGRANIKGVEAELTGVVFKDALSGGDSFILQGNLGYVDADYTFFDRNNDGVSDGDQLEFSKVPPTTYSVTALYETPLARAGDLNVRVSFHHEDSTFPDSENLRPRLPTINQLDAGISFTNAGKWLTLRAFGKNLTNRHELFQILPVVPGRNVFYPRPSRRVGVEATFKF